jgi:hypothetical protein
MATGKQDCMGSRGGQPMPSSVRPCEGATAPRAQQHCTVLHYTVPRYAVPQRQGHRHGRDTRAQQSLCMGPSGKCASTQSPPPPPIPHVAYRNMPSMPVGVAEQHHRRQSVVVVNYERQVNGFFALPIGRPAAQRPHHTHTRARALATVIGAGPAKEGCPLAEDSGRRPMGRVLWESSAATSMDTPGGGAVTTKRTPHPPLHALQTRHVHTHAHNRYGATHGAARSTSPPPPARATRVEMGGASSARRRTPSRWVVCS